MKWIIYWLSLMLILPLLYWFWRKKTYRLFLGVIILIVLIISWILPGKLAFSILKRELKAIEKKFEEAGWRTRGKEWERRAWQKLEKALKDTLQQEITAENRGKIEAEKEIIKWREEIKKAGEGKNKLDAEENYYLENQETINQTPSLRQEWEEKREKNREKLKEEIWPIMARGYKVVKEKEWEWARKWGGKEDPPIFLFVGEEFNYELAKERTTFKGSWKIVYDWVWHSDVIDFRKYGNAEPDFIQKRIREIWDYWNSGITRGGVLVDDYPIILLKNVDKITNPKLKKELSMVIDPTRNDRYGKYQIKDWDGKPTNEEGNIDLSKFILVVTTSTTNLQLPKEIQNKLKHIQPFLDKYFWLFFCSSTGAEVIIFLLIFKRKRKKKGKVDIQETQAIRNRK